ncbi:hypothetical protein D3C76_1286860 [compost metagenome]
MVNSVEELLQIDFHTPAIPRSHMGSGHLDGLMRASARTEAIAVVRKQRVENWRELLLQCLLDQTIYDAGDTQLSCAALRFGNFNRPHCLGMVLTGQQPGLEGWPILFHVASQVGNRHAIGTRRSLVADHALIRALEVGRCKHPLHQRVRLRVRPRH